MSDQGTPANPDQPPPQPPIQPDWSQPSQPSQPSPRDWSQPPAGGQGDPGYGQQYGQPPYGAPQYGQPQFGAQPYGTPYGQPTGAPPPSYLPWAIVTLIACCWPLSIVSIVFAAQVNNKFAIGDVAGAQESSRKAKQFAIWSAVLGLIFYALIAALFIAVAGSGTSTSTNTA